MSVIFCATMVLVNMYGSLALWTIGGVLQTVASLFLFVEAATFLAVIFVESKEHMNKKEEKEDGLS